MTDDCLFCKIVKGEVSSYKLYEDDICIVILDAYPDTDGHTLVIPKTHYSDIYSVPDDVLLHLYKVGRTMTTKLMTKLDKNASSLLFNYGDSQAIKHIHLHLLPDFMHRKNTLSKEEIYELLKD